MALAASTRNEATAYYRAEGVLVGTFCHAEDAGRGLGVSAATERQVVATRRVSYCRGVPTPRDVIGYMRAVGRGSPVDRPWSLPGMIVSRLRHGRGIAPKDSPLTLQDVMARADYRDLMTPKVAEGDPAPDFELARLGSESTVRLASLLQEGPVALIFGSYT